MICPKCGLINPDNAENCDCGFNFLTLEMINIYRRDSNRISGVLFFRCFIIFLPLYVIFTLIFSKIFFYRAPDFIVGMMRQVWPIVIIYAFSIFIVSYLATYLGIRNEPTQDLKSKKTTISLILTFGGVLIGIIFFLVFMFLIFSQG